MANCAAYLPSAGPFPIGGEGHDDLEQARVEWDVRFKAWRRAYNTCAECGCDRLGLRNHDPIWGDGDLYCSNGHYVRMFDSG